MPETRVQFSDSPFPEHLFSLLEGTWQGEGQGFFPTIDSFAYRETLTFERPKETALFYTQRTERRVEEGASLVASHWESGFMRALESGEVELANVQIGGRGEVLLGRLETEGGLVRLVLASATVTNDARMVATTRTFELEGDVLRYAMGMQTTRVGEMTPHVTAVLRRV